MQRSGSHWRFPGAPMNIAQAGAGALPASIAFLAGPHQCPRAVPSHTPRMRAAAWPLCSAHLQTPRPSPLEQRHHGEPQHTAPRASTLLPGLFARQKRQPPVSEVLRKVGAPPRPDPAVVPPARPGEESGALPGLAAPGLAALGGFAELRACRRADRGGAELSDNAQGKNKK